MEEDRNNSCSSPYWSRTGRTAVQNPDGGEYVAHLLITFLEEEN
jgi:hypothetical protein